jgi:hypothetical protein
MKAKYLTDNAIPADVQSSQLIAKAPESHTMEDGDNKPAAVPAVTVYLNF